MSNSRKMRTGYAAYEYLDQRYFFLILVITILLHMGAIYVWNMVPQAQLLDIPVHALNIKLGDADEATQEEIKAVQPDAVNKNDVESVISKMVQSQEEDASAQASKAMEKAVTPPDNDTLVVQESEHKLANVAKQFIRANPVQAAVTGNSNAKEAEMMSRYEQLISLWIEKFKVYPDEAKSKGMQGETVIRIRIDRQGNILYYVLEHSTGYPMLDHSAVDMVKRANPVPAVPTDYPKGDLIEFLIPVNFHLQ